MAAKSSKTTFGSEVRRLRLLAGMSLRHLARRSGISPVYLSDIENNRKPAPSAEILQALMSILHADHDAFTRLAMKSVEDYGGTARKPRISEQLSTDEYLIVVRKKQTLEPEEFRSWLMMTTVANTRTERKIKQQIRTVLAQRMVRDTPLQLEFDSGAAPAPQSAHTGRVRLALSPGPMEDPLRKQPPYRMVVINHYEGQSEKDAVEIYVDTCYREWRSMKSEFCRSRYLAALEHCTYTLRTISLGLPFVVDAE